MFATQTWVSGQRAGADLARRAKLCGGGLFRLQRKSPPMPAAANTRPRRVMAEQAGGPGNCCSHQAYTPADKVREAHRNETAR